MILSVNKLSLDDLKEMYQIVRRRYQVQSMLSNNTFNPIDEIAADSGWRPLTVDELMTVHFDNKEYTIKRNKNIQSRETNMSNDQYLLVCLMEECSEVAKECSKALRFGMMGDGYTGCKSDGNWFVPKERIVKELADLTGVVDLMNDMKLLSHCKSEDIDAKKASLLRYLEKNKNGQT